MRNRLFWCTVIICSIATSSASQTSLDSLAINVAGASREYSYTNKETAFYYGETNSSNKTSWRGFNVFGHEFLDDYEIRVNGMTLNRAMALATVFPDFLRRTYPGGIVEELRLADSLAAFSVTVITPRPSTVIISPFFSNARSPDNFTLELKSEIALVARKNHLLRTPQHNYPVWLGIHGKGILPTSQKVVDKGSFSPVNLSSSGIRVHRFFFAVGDSKEEAIFTARYYQANAQQIAQRRRERMERLLNQTFVESDNARFDKALAWAKISLDALVMNQVTKGIFAGLPWFNNYWGRDTFISLPGATLVQGHFMEARSILRSFATFQQRDSLSTDWGRIPNIVTTTDKAYNTADGTPRFVMMAKEYIERSGDTSFIKEVYPVILRSIEGALKYHTDSLGFLTHADAETWMDAVGPNGPWSPRGNRANDIQALWAQQLEAGVWFASELGDALSSHRWNTTLDKLRRNFPTFFVRGNRVIDHLNTDGSADGQLRPNQIFTSFLLDELTRAAITATVAESLTYKYGVASLSQDDENFHPFHQFEPLYPKDAAYHNGIVWTWVQGALISELCYFGREDLAWQVTSNTVYQILERGAVGTQSELLDAIARQGENEPRLSGTFSQAWNLAEFIRNFYDDYLGARPSLLRHHLVLRPRLPKGVTRVRANINLNGRALPIEYLRQNSSMQVSIDGSNLRKGGTAKVILLDPHSGFEHTYELTLPPGKRILATFSYEGQPIINQEVNAILIKHTSRRLLGHEFLVNTKLAQPFLKPKLKSLRGPDHPLIPHAVLKAKSSPVITTVVSAIDSIGDDRGLGASAGRFTYPANPAFVPGALDIASFSVLKGDSLAYFRLKFKALSNPGWHPEYGFQLTYVAIAIDKDGKSGMGKQSVGHNSNYHLADGKGFERLILIGGGVQVEDDAGKILCAYVPSPEDVSDPLGDASSGTISFAIPLRFLGGDLSSEWNWTILVGGQDDHGGAGLGEFRSVNKERSEWNGGGKFSPDASNVYDELLIGGRP